jgi:hypothetical protein
MRKTAKYQAAVKKALAQGLNQTASADTLYETLRKKGWMWDSATKAWVAIPPAQLPTLSLEVRFWHNKNNIKEITQRAITALQKGGFRLLTASAPYTCRPPAHLDARIYASFVVGPAARDMPDFAGKSEPGSTDTSPKN